MRINKYLASAGLGSRRKVEALVLSGAIFVNNKKVLNLATKVEDGDLVTVNGQEVSIQKKRYFAVYKPVGYVSTVEDEHAAKKVVDLVAVKGLYPVGRLDKESEGLIILTNDGDFAQETMHPSYEHEKEYLVDVAVQAEGHSEKLENAIKFFKCGIRIGPKRTAPAEIRLLSVENKTAKFNITLKQGLKRQIRQTFEKAGLSVKVLKRVRIGRVKLGDLAPGESIELTKADL